MAIYLLIIITITIVELAELFFKYVVCRFSILKSIILNRGFLFTSAFWSEIYYYIKIKRRLSTAFYPQIDE